MNLRCVNGFSRVSGGPAKLMQCQTRSVERRSEMRHRLILAWMVAGTGLDLCGRLGESLQFVIATGGIVQYTVAVLAPPISSVPPLQFSGHETFPLRQLWLRKAFDALAVSNEANPRSVFADDDAIARFGVGKNMVAAIRHWSLATEFIEEVATGGYKPTALGNQVFQKPGFDPFCEHPTTAWLVHWKLAGSAPRSTTWWWVFNCVVQQSFNKDSIVRALKQYCNERKYRVSESTLVRDVDVCISSYVPRSSNASKEDAAEPLLGELSLINPQVGTRGAFVFRRGPKRTLSPFLFTYSLIEFWNRRSSDTAVLAFERIAHDYGSPGRVFKLDENSVGELVVSLDALTDGLLGWSDSAGVRQVHRTGPISSARILEHMLRKAYA